MTKKVREMYLIHDCLVSTQEKANEMHEGKPENIQKVFIWCEEKDMERELLSPYEYLGWIFSLRDELEAEIRFYEREL